MSSFGLRQNWNRLTAELEKVSTVHNIRELAGIYVPRSPTVNEIPLSQRGQGGFTDEKSYQNRKRIDGDEKIPLHPLIKGDLLKCMIEVE